jgi:hypothetical protein
VENIGDALTLRGTGVAAKSGIKASYEAKVEYDGLWLSTVTLTPAAGPVEITSMRLRFAVPAASSAYVLTARYREWQENRIALDLFDKVEQNADEQSPVGHFWLTGHKTGLDVFTPTDGNWVYEPGRPNADLERAPDETRVTIMVIQKPVVLSRAAAYTLAFTATPTRPTPRRAWFAGDHDWIYQAGKWQSWTSLVQLDPQALSDGLVEKRKKGLRYFFQYGSVYSLGGNSHYEDFWGPTWEVSGGSTLVGDAFGGCPNSALRNVVVSHVEQLARAGGVGPYLNIFPVGWCRNPEHGCGYMDSFGRQAHTSTFPGLRDEMKRIHKLTHRYGCKVWCKNQSLFLVPFHAFADLWIPGSQYGVTH